VRIIGVLAGLVLYVRIFISATRDSTVSGHLPLVALAGLLLFFNLAVYGGLIGFGATLTGGMGASGLLAAAAGGGGPDSSGDGSSGLGSLAGAHTGLGLFDAHGRWFLWLLPAAVLVGTLAPLWLSRRVRRFAVRAEDYPLAGFWRPLVLGVLGALALVLLGKLSMELTMSFAGVNGMGVSASVGPNLFVALGLTALWLLLGYLAIASVHRPPRPGGGFDAPGQGDGFAGAVPPAEAANPVTAALFNADEETVG
jgi:hypothetical protein